MQTNLQKIDKVINFFKEALSKHKSLDKDFIEVFLETIDENKDKIKIIANKNLRPDASASGLKTYYTLNRKHRLKTYRGDAGLLQRSAGGGMECPRF